MTRHLGSVTVTANRPLSRIGLRYTPIDSASLRDNISLSMADVLGFNSSVFVKSAGRATLSTVSFRGAAPSHTAVTWNGLPVNSPSMGLTDFSMIPSYLIDRASLLHGPSSLTRTSAGMGGMVDLSTTPADINDGLTVQYVQGAGSFSTFDEFLRVTYGGEKWQFSTRAVLSTSDNDFSFVNKDRKEFIYDENHNITDSYYPRDRNRNGSYCDFHLLQQIYFQAPGRNNLGLQVWYTGSVRHVPLNTVDYIDSREYIKKQRDNILRAIASWKHTANGMSFNARAGYARLWNAYDYAVERSQGVMNSSITARTKTSTCYADGDWGWYPRDNIFVSSSLNVKYDHVSTVDHAALSGVRSYDRGRCDAGIALSARWQATAELGLSAVVREDIAGSDADAPAPALFADYVIYRPANLTLKGSVARNHHFASLNDLYYLPGGNPDLNPEQGWSYDLGASMTRTVGENASISASVNWYDSYINDWILWLPTNKGFFQARNIRNVHAYGIEANAAAAIRLHRDWNIDFNAGISWTSSINHSDPVSVNDKSAGKQLPYVPKVSASITGLLTWRLWSLQYKWCYYSKRYTMTSNEETITGYLPKYFMSNLSVERRIPLRPVEMSAKLTINNLFNADYQTIMSHPMPGTNFEFFLSVTI
ncbi:MAG: TonB-dependent receptor plug domain-containing protein [Muribaculaceae bacterium]|nr:TonB-dependent receptor plug domain-containing protein [Muribaculaceae bacterium]